MLAFGLHLADGVLHSFSDNEQSQCKGLKLKATSVNCKIESFHELEFILIASMKSEDFFY